MFLQLLYGAAILMVVYLFVYHYYTVYYTPGVNVLYDSPVTQKLFPGQTDKLWPTWGYDKQGLMKTDPTKYGMDKFWPKSGKGYQPKASGSGGPDPAGGMRSAKLPTEWELRPGYAPLPHLTGIYSSNDEIPQPTSTAVGWWGKPTDL
jgi:hypothetical protein